MTAEWRRVGDIARVGDQIHVTCYLCLPPAVEISDGGTAKVLLGRHLETCHPVAWQEGTSEYVPQIPYWHTIPNDRPGRGFHIELWFCLGQRPVGGPTIDSEVASFDAWAKAVDQLVAEVRSPD